MVLQFAGVPKNDADFSVANAKTRIGDRFWNVPDNFKLLRDNGEKYLLRFERSLDEARGAMSILVLVDKYPTMYLLDVKNVTLEYT